MALPVADVDVSAAYYVGKMGFEAIARGDEPVRGVVLERDGIRMAINENGGEPEQDGCAFRTDDVEMLHAEFAANGLEKLGDLKEEIHDDGEYKVFFVVAPDGLCFWFGQRSNTTD